MPFFKNIMPRLRRVGYGNMLKAKQDIRHHVLLYVVPFPWLLIVPPNLKFKKHKRQRELEEAAAAAERALAEREGRGGGSASSRSGKAQRVTFGADDLLAALTWVVVQVGVGNNPEEA